MNDATPTPHVDLRALLGLPEDASADQVEAARLRLIEVLTTPTGPSTEADDVGAPEDRSPDSVDPLAELGEEDEPPLRRVAAESRPTARVPRSRGRANVEARRTARRWAPLLTVAAIVGVVIAVQNAGRTPHPPVPETGSTSAPAAPAPAEPPAPQSVDTTAVAEQLQILEAEPENTDAMRSLADLHFSGGDYRTAAEWLERLIEISGDNVEDHLMLGVAHFNVAEIEAAEEAWNAALEVDPESTRAYYNLGFLHLSEEPPDMAAAEAAWQRVLELEPDSDMAATVENHLGAIQESGDA